jgi:hypothetical protein
MNKLAELIQEALENCESVDELDEALKKGFAGDGWDDVPGVDPVTMKELSLAVLADRLCTRSTKEMCIKFGSNTPAIDAVLNGMAAAGLSPTECNELLGTALKDSSWVNLRVICDGLGISGLDAMIASLEANPLRELSYDITPVTNGLDRFVKGIIPAVGLPISQVEPLLHAAVAGDESAWQILVDKGGELLSDFKYLVSNMKLQVSGSLSLYDGVVPSLDDLDELLLALIDHEVPPETISGLISLMAITGSMSEVESLCAALGIDGGVVRIAERWVAGNRPAITLNIQ